MFFLTFNDAPTGIFFSQVLDVIDFLRTEFKSKIRLVAFLSLRRFFENRKKIKQIAPSAIVLPMFPGLKNWKFNKWTLFLLCRIYSPQAIIARGVFAACLALEVKKNKLIQKVCYDGRGAIKAEAEEYGVFKNVFSTEEIFHLEKKTVTESDYRIAVSCQLVKYWQNEYQYTGNEHTIIPCTYNPDAVMPISSLEVFNNWRKKLEYEPDDKVLVYAGSSARWQSFQLMNSFFEKQLLADASTKILFLTKENKAIAQLKSKFPARVKVKWVEPDKVIPHLLGCDYGVIIREEKITNRVAAPTKFAEYLACGLAVLISDKIGDYSDFVQQHKCGYVFSEQQNRPIQLEKKTIHEKQQIQQLAALHFTKKAMRSRYQSVVIVLQ